MTLEQGLIAHLLADGAVTAEISTRVYHERLPENPVFPSMIYSRQNTNRDLTLEGVSSLTTVSLGLDIIGESTAQIGAAREAVITSLDGVTGNLGGVTVQFVRYSSTADTSVFDEDREYRITSLDIEVILNEG